jgi:outer membrane protein assembly factor BamB
VICQIAFVVGLVILLGATPALADCSDGACVPGGGPERTDCLAEFRAPRPNFPFFDPTRQKQKRAKEVRCFDGDAGCDVDGEVDGACTFPVDVCLAATDPALPGCTAGGVDRAALKVRKGEVGSLVADVAALVPTAETACSTGGRVTVALKARKKGGFKSGKALVKVIAKGGAGKDKDKLKLRCLPREWPTHGYDPRNRRASPADTGITPATIDDLELAWSLDIGSAVTSTPTVAHGLVYVTSWNGTLYAVNPKKGKVKWTFETEGPAGIQSSAAVTADGRVLIADGNVNVHALDAKKGKLLWTRNIGTPPVDHVWASVQLAHGAAYIGVSAFLDDPATPGRLYALDLDTGEVQWSFKTVPDRICRTDTQVECTTSADCPFGGECTEGLGAAVTATVAVDPTGTQVYMNTVGSQKFPSIGDSDSMMRFDAATGDVVWRNRVNAPEQFGYCEEDTAIDCSTGSACGAFGPCTTKFFYHDFGFLNGPMLVADGTGRSLVVSGSKDGSLYAFDPDTGDVVWREEILPEPVSPGFAAWGLFNGAIGFANGLVYGALYGHLRASQEVPDHMKAFHVEDGTVAWEDDIGPSWGDIAVAGGVVYAGTQETPFSMPTSVTGGATIVGDLLLIPYGEIGPGGGVQAWRLP